MGSESKLLACNSRICRKCENKIFDVISVSIDRDEYKLNLRKLENTIKYFETGEGYGENLIFEHFQNQIMIVQEKTEIKINKINDLSEKIIDTLKIKSSSITTSYLDRLNDINTAKVTAFLDGKKTFLENNESINSAELKELNKQTLNMQSSLNRKIIYFKPLVFDNQCVIFKPNNDEIVDNLLGEIEWSPFIFPTVIYSKIIIIKINFL